MPLIELLMAAVGVLRFDPAAVRNKGIPDTCEKLHDRAIEQFLDLYDAEPRINLPSTIGPVAKRRSIWVRGDLMLRIQEIAGSLPCPVSGYWSLCMAANNTRSPKLMGGQEGGVNILPARKIAVVFGQPIEVIFDPGDDAGNAT